MSVYSFRRDEANAAVGFDDAIDTARLADAATWNFQSRDGSTPSWAARLYLWEGEAKPPSWLGFLRDGFGDQVDVPDRAQTSAVVVVKVRYRVDRLFAVTFGAGRYFLRKDAVDRGYGLRVALNAMYEGDEEAESLEPTDRVRQIDSRTVGVNTLRTRRQANRTADFSVFDLDIDGDQLQGIAGTPVDIDGLGRWIRGADNVRIGRSFHFADLGALCRTLARYHERKEYQRRFRFIDNLTSETNPARVAQLRQRLPGEFLASPASWEFSPPALIDFDVVARFEIPAIGLEGTNVSTEEIAGALSEDVTAKYLDDVVIRAFSDDDELVGQWVLRECLDGQLTYSDSTYVVESGDFYLIQDDYLEALDAFVGGVPISHATLPASVRIPQGGELVEIDEGAYNLRAAASDASFLLLDKKTVIVEGKTSAIEVCDILTLDRQLIHVKRKFSSSALSHLFAQGYVSSELFVDNPAYRSAVRRKIGTSHAGFRDLISETGFVAADFEVVYGIIGDWGAHTLTRLPFFSKVNLRKHVRTLRRFGFAVTYLPIQVVDP